MGDPVRSTIVVAVFAATAAFGPRLPSLTLIQFENLPVSGNNFTGLVLSQPGTT
jgi:hypothetical protein